MNAPQTELPRYRCHKIVRAAKITAIERDAVTILTFGDISACKQVSYDFDQKHQPEVGGYYVVYDDGYTSYSPAKAFEEGYTREPADFRDRVRREKSELDEKREALAAFFGTSLFASLPGAEQQRMREQLDAMREYSRILLERIDNF